LEGWKEFLVGAEPVKLPHKFVSSKSYLAMSVRLRNFAVLEGCVLKKTTTFWSLLHSDYF